MFGKPSHRRLEEEVIALFDALRAPVLRYLLSMRLPIQDAEEVVQEVFLALFQHLKRNKPRTNLQAWVFKVAHNQALKKRAQTNRMVAVEPSPQPDHYPGPEERYSALQTQRTLQAVVRALPETDQWCLALRTEGLTYREIAEALGISLGGVAASLERALTRLSRASEAMEAYVPASDRS